MVSGNAWLHHLWNGDIVNIRNQVDNPEDFKFQKSDEGIPVGSDTFAIPVNAEHPGHGPALHRVHARARERRPERGVRGLPDALRAGATEAFAGLVKDDPAIAVTIEDLEDGQQFENLKGEGRRAWDRTWTEVKAS